MKLIQPIVIKNIDKNLSLPICIFKSSEGVLSCIEYFIDEEKEKFFKINIEKVDQGRKGLTYYTGNSYILGELEFQNHIITPYKLSISKQTDYKHELKNEKYITDFVFKIVIGCGLSVSIKTDTSMFDGSISMESHESISRRESKIIDDKIITRIKRLMILIHDKSVDRNKIELLKSLLSIAISLVPLDISGAFYVSILESIFVPDKDTEIKY